MHLHPAPVRERAKAILKNFSSRYLPRVSVSTPSALQSTQRYWRNSRLFAGLKKKTLAKNGVWDLTDEGLVQVLESSGVHDEHEFPNEEKTEIQKAYLRAISLAQKSIRIVCIFKYKNRHV